MCSVGRCEEEEEEARREEKSKPLQQTPCHTFILSVGVRRRRRTFERRKVNPFSRHLVILSFW